MSGDTIVAARPALILMQLGQKAVPDGTSYSQRLIWSKWSNGMEESALSFALNLSLNRQTNTGAVLYNLL